MFDGGDENLYSYVQNDPVNAVDPDGKEYTLVETLPPQEAMMKLGASTLFGATIGCATGVAEQYTLAYISTQFEGAASRATSACIVQGAFGAAGGFLGAVADIKTYVASPLSIFAAFCLVGGSLGIASNYQQQLSIDRKDPFHIDLVGLGVSAAAGCVGSSIGLTFNPLGWERVARLSQSAVMGPRVGALAGNILDYTTSLFSAMNSAAKP